MRASRSIGCGKPVGRDGRSHDCICCACTSRAHFTREPGASAAEETATTSRDPKLVAITQQINQHPLFRNAPDALPSNIPARTFALAFLNVLRDGSSLPLFSQVESTVAQLRPGDFRTTLAAFVHHAAGDVATFHAHIGQWLDAAMDQVSFIYKRHVQYMLLVLGAALAVAPNVEAFHLAYRLWYNSSASGALVANAGSASPDLPLLEALRKLQGQPLPLGWTKWGLPTYGQVGAGS